MSESDIWTEFGEPEVTDHGVESAFEAEEEFAFEGERVERETRVMVLEDGGVTISQSTDQGTIDSLTLNDEVARRLLQEYEDSHRA